MPFLKHGMAGGSVEHGVSQEWIKKKVMSGVAASASKSPSERLARVEKFGRRMAAGNDRMWAPGVGRDDMGRKYNTAMNLADRLREGLGHQKLEAELAASETKAAKSRTPTPTRTPAPAPAPKASPTKSTAKAKKSPKTTSHAAPAGTSPITGGTRIILR